MVAWALFEDVQELTVITSNAAFKAEDREAVRDQLWGGLSAAWRNTLVVQRAENIELAHVKLHGHRREMTTRFK
jgi:hypothetical protein